MAMPELPAFSGSSIQDFLSKKERVVGKGVTLVGLGLLGWLGYHALPFVNNFLGMATEMVGRSILLGAEVGFAGLATWVLLRKETWSLANHFYVILAKKASKKLVKFGHLEILEAFANEYLQERFREFKEKMAFGEAKHKIVARRIEENQEKIDGALEQANVLKGRSFKNNAWNNEKDRLDFQLKSNEINLLNESNKRLEKQLVRLERLCKITEKLGMAFEYQIKMVEMVVEVLTTEYEASRGAAEATEAMSAILPENDRRRVFDMAVKYTMDQIAMFDAKVDTFVKMAPNLILDTDLTSEINENRLLDQLSAWDANADGVIANAQKAQAQIASGEILVLPPTRREKEAVPVNSGSAPVAKKRYRLTD